MPAARAGVLVVGSLNVDLVVRVARLPAPGETVGGGTFARFGGGKGANAAVAAARFGAPVTFVGAVGDDELGREGLEQLRSEGVDVSRCLVLPGLATGVALVVVDGTGENQIAVAAGANAALDGEAVSESLDGLDEADLEVLRDGVVLTNLEIADEAVLAAGEFAARHGMRFVLNVAPARSLPPALRELDSLIVANEGEAAALGDVGGTVVVTRGAAGAVIREGRSQREVAASPVEVVDTTGAGDTFCGVLAAALADRLELDDAVALAVRAATRSVTVAGERKPLGGRLMSALVGVLARHVVEAKRREYEVFGASGLDWTLVRPPRVVDAPARGTYQAGDRLFGRSISKADLAQFMVDQLADRTYLGAAPFVS